MKILHVVHCYAPSRGGSQWLTQQLAEGCVRRHGDTATVFTTNAVSTASFWGSRDPLLPPGEERINGVTVRRFPFVTRLRTLRMAAASLAYRLRLPGNDWLRTCYQGPIVPGLAAAVAASGADVVFATAFPLRHMYDALAGARSSGIPLVYLGALHLDDHWGYDRASIYRAIAQCSAYIAHTAAERDHLVARGIAAAKIVEIGAGVDVGLFAAADGARIRREFGVGDRLVVGALGKQVERKRYDVLLAAMERVWQVHPTAVLLIAGATGSYTPALLAEVQRINASQPGRVVVLSDFDESREGRHPGGDGCLCAGVGAGVVRHRLCRGVGLPATGDRRRDAGDRKPDRPGPRRSSDALWRCCGAGRGDPDAAGCAGAAAGAGRGRPRKGAAALHVGCHRGCRAGGVQPCPGHSVGAVFNRTNIGQAKIRAGGVQPCPGHSVGAVCNRTNIGQTEIRAVENRTYAFCVLSSASTAWRSRASCTRTACSNASSALP
jgi:glycosyltransferase involved in cell wall biosynthesis